MKQNLLYAVLLIGLLSGCSTAFKAGQTPDDVYYSPAAEGSQRDEVNQQKQRDQYQDYVSSQDDRYLRMKVANRNRWSGIDNFDYWYDSRYDFSYSYGYNGWNNYNTAWNPNWNLLVGPGFGNGYNLGWNSPVYTVVRYTHPVFTPSGSTSGTNIYAYKNRNYNNTNLGYNDPKTGNFIPNGNNNSFGNLLKRVFTNGSSGNNNNYPSSYDRPARTFTTPTNGTQPATSSSAGGASGGYNSTGTSTSAGRGGKGG